MCADSSGAAKQQSVQTQLFHACTQDSAARVEGLEKALSEITTHCRDDQLQAACARHSAYKKSKLAQRQQELTQAQQTGNSDNICKNRNKLHVLNKNFKKHNRH